MRCQPRRFWRCEKRFEGNKERLCYLSATWADLPFSFHAFHYANDQSPNRYAMQCNTLQCRSQRSKNQNRTNTKQHKKKDVLSLTLNPQRMTLPTKPLNQPLTGRLSTAFTRLKQLLLDLCPHISKIHPRIRILTPFPPVSLEDIRRSRPKESRALASLHFYFLIPFGQSFVLRGVVFRVDGEVLC